MKTTTIINTSQNFCDPKAIAGDLLSELPETPAQNTLGLLVCDSTTDYEQVAEIISSKINFDVIGVTTFKIPQYSDVELSASFTIITKPGLEISVAAATGLMEDDSKPMEDDSEPAEDDSKPMEDDSKPAADAYNQCIANLNTEPKLLIPLVPMISGLTADRYMKALFKLAGETPVFGGMSTGNLINTEAAVMVNGRTYKDALVLVALGGPIAPVFSVGSSLTPMTAHSPTVTESNENTVKKVDDMTFCEYMSSLGIAPEDRENGVDALMQYGPTPCRLTHKLEDDDGVPEIRCISFTNVSDGSATFSSDIPVGTRLNMGVIQYRNVEESYEKCIRDIENEIKASDEPESYSALLAIPCVARYFALHGENLEQLIDGRNIPEGLTLSSFYGFLEVGPTKSSSGEIHNRSHNASVVMCSF